MLHQGWEWVALDTPITFTEQSTPATPLEGYGKVYPKTTGLFYMGDNGVEVGPLAAAVTTLDHGALTGLGDDDHTQYALLLGRSGGQTLIGGTAASNNLFLRSTSHATKGGIIFGDASGGSIHPSLVSDYHQFYKNSSSSGADVQIANEATADTTSLGALEWGTRGASNSDKRTALIHCRLSGSGATHPAGQMEFFTRIAGGTTFNQMTFTALGHLLIGRTSIVQELSGRRYLSIEGTTLSGGVEFATGQTEADAIGLGIIQWTDKTSTLADKRRTAISCVLSGATANQRGGYMAFFTSANTVSSVTERFRIGESGQWGIGGATYGSAGSYFRSAGSAAAPVWSTLILPNAATANYIVYASSSNTYGESSNLQFDGTDFLLGSGIRARMASQNRFRHLNSLVSAYRNSNQTISNNTNTAISFDTETFDTDGMWAIGDPTKLVAQLAGKYIVTCSARFDGNATGTRVVAVRKNGTTFLSQNGSKDVDGNHVIVTGSPTIATLAASDYVEIIVFQDSGGDLSIIADTRTTGAMAYIGE